MKTAALIPAGGAGKRMPGHVSKQYLLLDGIPLLVHTLRIFQCLPIVHDIFLVVPSDDIQFVSQTIVRTYGITKVRQIVSGGRERQDSVKNGLDAMGDEHDIVIIHDGVRPFISEDLVHLAVIEASIGEAVTIGVPVKDTVKMVTQDGWVIETTRRDCLWLTQTPQVFKREIIKEAYRRAYNDHYYGTDDASLVERIGGHVKMIPGSYDNIKITTKDDLLLAEGLLKSRETIKR
jgi:2-C-methyl-D-erythritol 4-phosphate cytidylyltransferase